MGKKGGGQLKSAFAPLFKLALVSGVDTAISMHIRRGVDVNASDEYGQFPLLLAAKSGNANICAMLLEAGADPLKTDAHGQTALAVAQSRGMQNVVSLLSSHPHSTQSTVLIEEAVLPQTPCHDQIVGSLASEHSDALFWLPLDEPALLPPDSTFAIQAGKIQFQISSHTPIDTYEDWSATEIDFPNELTATRARYSSGDRKQIIHRILSDGLSDGFVTHSRVLNDLYKEHEEPDETEYFSILVTLEELQIYLDDETHEYLPANNELALSDSQGRDVDEGIKFFDELLQGGDNVTRLYARNFGPSRRLSREQEILLAKSIEHSLSQIMAAAFSWPGTWKLFAREIARLTAGEIDLDDVVELTSIEPRISSEKPPVFGGLAEEIEDEFHADQQTGDEAQPLTVLEAHPVLEALTKLRYSIEATFEASDWPANDWAAFEIARTEWAAIVTGFRFTPSFAITISGGPKRLLQELDRLEALIATYDSKDKAFEDTCILDISNECRKATILEVENIISKFPRLTVADSQRAGFGQLIEELAVATSQAGCSLSKLKLIADEIAKHEQKLEADKKTFVEANLRLVYSIARKYLVSGMDISDLVQEGNLGLLRAVDKFDYRRGFKFSTYSVNWIRQKILRYISDFGRTIRLPVHIGETVRGMERTEREIEKRTNRYPTAAEVAGELGIEEHKIRAYRRISQEIVSLTKAADDTEDAEEHLYSNLVAPDELAEDLSMRATIARVLETLTRREAKVIQLRFGIGCNEHTLEETGQMFDVTRERIRQIESKALKKLRHPTRSVTLSSLIGLDIKPNNGLELIREKNDAGENNAKS